MQQQDWLAEQFEAKRTHLRAVAYRMLGSLNEADDAVQEAWLKLNNADTSDVHNLGGWLTTVVGRVCLDMLRSRKSRREESHGIDVPEPVLSDTGPIDPEQEALLAESVGLALLVVLEKLDPAERLAFVLHDMFAVPFEEIGSIVGRSAAASRQLASRARRRVHGGAPPEADLGSQRPVVDAFLAAMRNADFEALVAVLDPDVLVHGHGAGGPIEIRGALNWAKGALAYSQAIRSAQPALIDGDVGLILAPGGRLLRAIRFTIINGKIAEVDVIADPQRLDELDIAVLEND